MAGSVEVRRAVAADAEAIAHLLHDFNLEFDEPAPSVPLLAARCEKLLGDDAIVVLLAEEPPITLVVLRLRPALWTEGEEAHLQELYVVPARRREGIGRGLVEAAVTVAREAGARTVDLGTGELDAGARALYERLGFVNREGGPDGPRMLFYERELGPG